MLHWRRWLLLAILLPVYAVSLTYLALAAAVILIDPSDGWRNCVDEVIDVVFRADIDDALDPWSDLYFWLYFAGPSLLVVVTQFLFLLPMIKPPRLGAHGRSLLISMIMAGLVGAGLVTGLFLAIVDTLRIFAGGQEPGFISDSLASWSVWVMLPLMLSWIAWTILIAMFARKRHEPRMLRRIVGLLFAGTLIEVLIVVPLDIMVRRRTSCHCETGTAHALGLSTWALLWLTGPGIVLAVLSKRRRLWWDTNCPACGYAKGPSPGAQCPECGCVWKANNA